jgi:hypothetical protein
MDSRAFLMSYREQLAVAFKYYPLIRLYDRNGNLVRESRIGIPVLERLEKYNQDRRFTNPAPNVVNLKRSLAGIQAVGGRIFVLLHLPRIEIHEIDLSGRDVATFYVDGPTDIIEYAGFVVWGGGPDLFAYVVSKSADDSVLWVLEIGADRTLTKS